MPAIVNTSDLEIRRAREELALGMRLDAKRPTAWAQYGYPQAVTFEQLLTAYERGGAGHGAVYRILDKCWQALPRIKKPEADKPGPWEKKVGAVPKAVQAWAKLRDLDRRNMVGRHAALIYREGGQPQAVRAPGHWHEAGGPHPRLREPDPRGGLGQRREQRELASR